MVSARRGLGNRVFAENQAQKSVFVPHANRLHGDSVRPSRANTTRIVASSLVEFWSPNVALLYGSDWLPEVHNQRLAIQIFGPHRS